MTLAELRTSARRKTKTTATNYIDADLDSDINLAYGKVWLMLQEAEGYKNLGADFEVIDFESETGLVEQDLGYNGEYPMPVGDDATNTPGAISLQEVHVDYGDGYKKAEIINRRALAVSMFNEDQDDYYSEQYPKVFVLRDSYLVRPKNNTGATITDGIKIVTLARQPELIETTDEPSFEKNLHELISYEVAMGYYEIYPEKYSALVEKRKNELETQAISLYESKVPLEKRFTGQKEKY